MEIGGAPCIPIPVTLPDISTKMVDHPVDGLRSASLTGVKMLPPNIKASFRSRSAIYIYIYVCVCAFGSQKGRAPLRTRVFHGHKYTGACIHQCVSLTSGGVISRSERILIGISSLRKVSILLRSKITQRHEDLVTKAIPTHVPFKYAL